MSKKLNLLIVRPTMSYGGADRVTLVLLKNLDRSRYQVSLLLMRNEGVLYDEIPSDVTVIDAKARNLWFFLVPLINAIRSAKADVVFSTCGGANMPVAIAAFMNPFRKWKAIVSERNVIFPPGKNILKRTLMVVIKAFFYRFVNVLTAVSIGVKNDMRRKLLLYGRTIHVVDNPLIDEELKRQADAPVNDQWFRENRQIPVILHVGRFVHQKNHRLLLTAFREVTESTACHLVLLGEGPLLGETKELVDKLELDSVVNFYGFDKNPFRFMSKCDVFVLSSNHEGMPGVLIQAMACGAPVVSTDCPFGPNEIISEPGIDGMLVPVGDSKSLAAAILELIKNNKRRTAMGESAKKSVSRFDVETAMRTYVNAIEA